MAGGTGPGTRVLKAFDRQTYLVFGLYERDKMLLIAEGVVECARQFQARAKLDGWMLITNVRFDATIERDEMRIRRATFMVHDTLESGDEEFQRCYDSAVKEVVIPCPSCRPGELSFTWTLQKPFKRRGPDPEVLIPMPDLRSH